MQPPDIPWELCILVCPWLPGRILLGQLIPMASTNELQTGRENKENLLFLRKKKKREKEFQARDFNSREKTHNA